MSLRPDAPDPLAKLEALEDLAAKATPGPWRISMSGYSVKAPREIGEVSGVYQVASVPGVPNVNPKMWEPWMENAAFIAASRSALPVLLAFLRGEMERHFARPFSDPVSGDNWEICSGCGMDAPCPTRLAAEKALEALP